MQDVTMTAYTPSSVAPQPLRGKPQQTGDSFTVGVTDNKGFIIGANLTEDNKKISKIFVASDLETLINIIMEIAPKMVSGAGVSCCDDKG